MSNLDPKERQKKLRDLLLFLAIAFVVVMGLGILGFKYIVRTNWIDAFYNSALQFSRAGSGAVIKGTGPKIFVSIYGIIAGLIFVGLAVYVIDGIVDAELFGE